MLSFVDRSNIAFAELKMRNDPTINLTVADFGLGAGIFFAGYGVMQLPPCSSFSMLARPVPAFLAWVPWARPSAPSRAGASFTLSLPSGRVRLATTPALSISATWAPDELAGVAAAMFTMIGAITGVGVGNLTAGLILSAPVVEGLLGLFMALALPSKALLPS